MECVETFGHEKLKVRAGDRAGAACINAGE
jgi:hypothetical protein